LFRQLHIEAHMKDYIIFSRNMISEGLIYVTKFKLFVLDE